MRGPHARACGLLEPQRVPDGRVDPGRPCQPALAHILDRIDRGARSAASGADEPAARGQGAALSSKPPGRAPAASGSPLAAAFDLVLLPALATEGFTRFGRRNLGRVHDGILQFVNVQTAASGPTRFCVNYATLPLFRPHDFSVLSLGDRLLDAQGEDAWFPVRSPEKTASAMRAALSLLRAQALPWFEETRTVAGLLAQLPAPGARADPHDLFDRACCLARLGRLRESAQAAAQARRLYLYDGRAAWREPAELCAMLFAAAVAGHVEPLLEEWERLSLRELRLAAASPPAPGR